MQSFQHHKKEHLRNVRTAAKGSRIANHAWTHNHAFDFDNASIIDKVDLLEAWHTKLSPNADNSSCPLLDNITFFLTNIHNYFHFHYFTISLIFIQFSLFLPFLSFTFYLSETIIQAGKILQFFNHFSQR